MHSACAQRLGWRRAATTNAHVAQSGTGHCCPCCQAVKSDSYARRASCVVVLANLQTGQWRTGFLPNCTTAALPLRMAPESDKAWLATETEAELKAAGAAALIGRRVSRYWLTSAKGEQNRGRYFDGALPEESSSVGHRSVQHSRTTQASSWAPPARPSSWRYFTKARRGPVLRHRCVLASFRCRGR